MSDENIETIKSIESLEKTFKCKTLIEIKNLVTKEKEYGFFINKKTKFVVLRKKESDDIIYETEELFKHYKILGAYFELNIEMKQ